MLGCGAEYTILSHGPTRQRRLLKMIQEHMTQNLMLQSLEIFLGQALNRAAMYIISMDHRAKYETAQRINLGANQE